MAALKTLLDKLDELPEALHEYYVEKDGKFTLELENVDDHPSVRALKNALEAQKAQRRTLSDELKTLKDRVSKIPEDFDPEELERLRAQIAEYEADPKNKDRTGQEELVAARKQLEQKITNMEKKFTDEIAKRDAKIKEKDTVIARHLIDDGLTKALIENNVDKGLMKAATALLRQNINVVEDDGEYQALVETDVGPVDIPKYVADWAASDEGRPFIPPAKGVDSGGQNKQPKGPSGNNNAKNPWSKDSWNLTEQGKLLRADRAKATQLAKAEGHTLPEPM